MTSDHYHDDPQEFYADDSINKSFFGNKIFGISILFAALVFGNTLAANISLNSNRSVEFGQGLALSTVCDSSVLVTPYASFANSAGSGSFNFSSLKLSGLDVNACNGATFILKAYDSTTATPLTLSTGQNSVTVLDSGTVLSLASGQSGYVVTDTGTIGSISISFSSPLALATSVYKITIESSGSVNSTQSSSSNAISATYVTVSNFALYPDIFASTEGGKIYASGDSNVYVSSDTGTTWSVTSIPTADAMTVAASQDGTKVWVAGANGRIYYSNNSGSSFTLKYNYDGYSSFEYIATDSTGTKLVAARCVGSPVTLLTTSDSGSSWQTFPAPVSNQCGYYGIALSGNGNQIFVARYNGYIYKTSDSGATWTQLTGAGSRYWKGFALSPDGNTIVASANNDFAYYSTNGGSTWTKASGPISSYWQTAALDPTGRVMAVASANGEIYVSVDFGATWNEVTLGISRQYWYSSSISSDAKYLFLGTYGYGSGSNIYKISIPGA